MSPADGVVELPLMESVPAETSSDTPPSEGEVSAAPVQDLNGILRTVAYRATDSTASFTQQVSRTVGIPVCTLRVWPPNSANYLLFRAGRALRDEVPNLQGLFETQCILSEPVQVTLDGARDLAVAIRAAWAPGHSLESVLRQSKAAARMAEDLLLCLDDLEVWSP